jgi:hypothetical protein
MKGIIQSQITPQQKMVAVNNKFGNTNIKNQQGTTRVLFDALPLDSRTTFRFFENATTRQFPLTNVGSEGNRLEVGSTLTIEKIYFRLITFDAVNNTITAATPINKTLAGDFYGPFATGEIDVLIANSQVVKQLPTTFALLDAVANNIFNPTAVNNSDVSFGFATDIVIPPLLEYIASLRTTSYDLTGITSTHIQLFISGTAGIIAPQSTF